MRHTSAHMSMHMSAHMPIHKSIHMSIHKSTHMRDGCPMSACISIHMPTHMSAHVFIRPPADQPQAVYGLSSYGLNSAGLGSHSTCSYTCPLTSPLAKARNGYRTAHVLYPCHRPCRRLFLLPRSMPTASTEVPFRSERYLKTRLTEALRIPPSDSI